MRNFFPAVFPGDAVILLAQQCPIYYYHTVRQNNHCILDLLVEPLYTCSKSSQ